MAALPAFFFLAVSTFTLWDKQWHPLLYVVHLLCVPKDLSLLLSLLCFAVFFPPVADLGVPSLEKRPWGRTETNMLGSEMSRGTGRF